MSDTFSGGKWGDDQWVAIPTAEYYRREPGPTDAVVAAAVAYPTEGTREPLVVVYASVRGLEPSWGASALTVPQHLDESAQRVAAGYRRVLDEWVEAGNHPAAYIERLHEDGGNGITQAVTRYWANAPLDVVLSLR